MSSHEKDSVLTLRLPQELHEKLRRRAERKIALWQPSSVWLLANISFRGRPQPMPDPRASLSHPERMFGSAFPPSECPPLGGDRDVSGSRTFAELTLLDELDLIAGVGGLSLGFVAEGFVPLAVTSWPAHGVAS